MSEHEQGSVRVENTVAGPQRESAPREESVERTERETGRVEAFSDAVFAIAITLLVLDLRLPSGPPDPTNQQLLDELTQPWPHYLAFVTSFAWIGAIWINHHRIFTLIRRIDGALLLLNLLLLFGVTLLPFPTSVLADHLGHQGEQVAALLYAGLNMVIGICLYLLWHHASRGNRLLAPNADPGKVRSLTRQFRFGPLYYLVVLAVAFFSPLLSVVMQLLLLIDHIIRLLRLPGFPGFPRLPRLQR